MTDSTGSLLRDAGPLRDGTPEDNQDERHDEFLGALAALGGSAGNGRLRDVLGWDEATYDAVKAELLSRGLIVPGRGRGGSVALTDAVGGSDGEGGGEGGSSPIGPG
ncbi:MAG: hypothetical protein ACKOZT_00130, partial [Cyanobium sp.]